MRHLGIAATLLLVVPTVASATPMAGMTVTAEPARSTDNVERGGFATWGAWGVGSGGGYLGFEVGAGNQDVPDDFGVTFHILGGVQSRLSDHVVVLADAGAGVTQQTSFELQIFESEDEGGFKSVQVLP